jgi:hypothetical protein
MDGNQNTEISKLILKARGNNLDIKEHKKWKCKVSVSQKTESHGSPQNVSPSIAGRT